MVRVLSSLTQTNLTIIFLGFLTSLCNTLIIWTLLLHLNHIQFTTTASSAFFIQLRILPLVIPIPANILITSQLGRFPAKVLASVHLLVAFAILLLTFTHSRFLYAISIGIFSPAISLRIARITLLSQTSRKTIRTDVLAVHQLCVPLGAIFAPALWLFLQRWKGDYQTSLGLIVDRFTLVHFICVMLMLMAALLSLVGLRNLDYERQLVSDADAIEQVSIPPSVINDYGTTRSAVFLSDSQGTVRVETDIGPRYMSISFYRFSRFTFYTLIMLGVRTSTMILAVSFQPILIDIFRVSEAELGRAYLIVAVVALIPPIVVALLSGRLGDRVILSIGIALKLCGWMLFMPFWRSKWTVIAGYVLVLKASMFFVPTTMSLFTKIMGKLSGGITSLAWLWSIASLSPALVQLLMSAEIVDWYGTWRYGLFAVPCVLVAIGVATPMGWDLLDSESEVSRKVVEATSKTKRQTGKKQEVEPL